MLRRPQKLDVTKVFSMKIVGDFFQIFVAFSEYLELKINRQIDTLIRFDW